MKRIVAVLLVSALCCCAFAQPGEGRGPHSGKGRGSRPDMAALAERIQAEKKAYITEQLALSSAEAEKFWPVYNAAADSRKELMKVEKKAYRDLQAALDSGSGDVKSKLDAYLAARKACADREEEIVGEYLKVLSYEKAGRLFVAEENFRRIQIGKLRGAGDGGPRPGVSPRR